MQAYSLAHEAGSLGVKKSYKKGHLSAHVIKSDAELLYIIIVSN